MDRNDEIARKIVIWLNNNGYTPEDTEISHVMGEGYKVTSKKLNEDTLKEINEQVKKIEDSYND